MILVSTYVMENNVMSKSFYKPNLVLALVAAGALAAAASAASAAYVNQPLGRSSPLDTVTAKQPATMQPAAVSSGTGTPVIATERPGAPGTGANPGDLARAEMQANAQSLPALPESVSKSLSLEASRPAAPQQTRRYGRAGWDPAIAQLQDTPQALPWAG